MKIAAKLVSIIILGTIIILAVDGYFTARHDIEVFETNMKRNAHLLGRAMRGHVIHVWLTEGQDRALQVISEVNKGAKRIYVRWVWLNALPEEPYSPRVPREKLDVVMQGQEASFKERNKDGTGYLYTYVLIKVDEKKTGALELSESLSQLDDYTRNAVFRIFILMGLLVLAGGFAAMLLGFGMIGRPLNRLIEKVRQVGKGDLSEPLNLRGGGEFSELAATLNTMCRQLEEAHERAHNETAARITAIEQLRHADRLKTIGGLASGIAHELGTPLNVISGRADLIATESLSGAEVVESANIIKAQSKRMTMIIRQLLDFARRSSPRKTLVDLRQIVRNTLDLMAPLGKKQKATLHFTGEDGPAMAKADAGQIQQVMTNLIVNALQAMPKGGMVEVGIRREHVRPPETIGGSAGNYFTIYVRDDGEGISEENMQYIFEPFFTTKDISSGTGLGLSLAYDIIQEHSGWIEVKSKKGQGSCFSIYLPQEVEG